MAIYIMITITWCVVGQENWKKIELKPLAVFFNENLQIRGIFYQMHLLVFHTEAIFQSIWPVLFAECKTARTD